MSYIELKNDKYETLEDPENCGEDRHQTCQSG